MFGIGAQGCAPIFILLDIYAFCKGSSSSQYRIILILKRGLSSIEKKIILSAEGAFYHLKCFDFLYGKSGRFSYNLCR